MNISKIIYYIIVALIAAVAILLIVSVLPVSGNFKVLTVLSGSMEPAIKTGAMVVIKPVSDYRIGDIITFGNAQLPVTHRIHDIKVVAGNPVYITKGDANNAPDQKEVNKKEIIGKVLFNIPFVGYAVEFAKKPMGFMFIIIVPSILIVYDEVRKIYEEIKKKKNNE